MINQVLDVRVRLLLMGLVILALAAIDSREPQTATAAIMIWFVACAVTEFMSHPALNQVSIVSMAPAAHLAALVALPISWAIPLVMLTTGIGALWNRGGLIASAVRVGATGIAASGAASILWATGTVAGTGDALSLMVPLANPLRLASFLSAGIVYIALNQGILAAFAARRLRTSCVRAWREVFGHETGLVTSLALVTVAFLIFVSYQAIGYRGLLLSLLPVLFIRDSSRRNVELKTAQSQLIERERLAAKGEMAAEIGHELNNYLAAISGRAQLLLRKLGKEGESGLTEYAENVRRTATEMAELAKGLMRFSHPEAKRTSFGVNDLIDKTVAFVRPQTRFQRLEFLFEPGPDVPPVEMDPGQIQQVLLSLFGKVADHSGESSRSLCIRTKNDGAKNEVIIELASPRGGPTATDGNGSADEERVISTIRRILDRHKGRLESGAEETGIETYRVLLPAA